MLYMCSSDLPTIIVPVVDLPNPHTNIHAPDAGPDVYGTSYPTDTLPTIYAKGTRVIIEDFFPTVVERVLNSIRLEGTLLFGEVGREVLACAIAPLIHATKVLRVAVVWEFDSRFLDILNTAQYVWEGRNDGSGSVDLPGRSYCDMYSRGDYKVIIYTSESLSPRGLMMRLPVSVDMVWIVDGQLVAMFPHLLFARKFVFNRLRDNGGFTQFLENYVKWTRAGWEWAGNDDNIVFHEFNRPFVVLFWL